MKQMQLGLEYETAPKTTSALMPPVEIDPEQVTLAPAPIIDKYPIILGQNLTLAYLSAVYRLCTTGYRYQFVDALHELLEHDPHARGVVRQRVLPLACARLDLQPAKLPVGDKDEKLAQEICDETERQLDRLECRSQAFAALAWGIVTGVSGAENVWDRSESQWEISKARFIHSRRLNMPDPGTWDVHVWDQGQISVGFPQSPWMGVTNAGYGLRCRDYPGKFIVHQPQLNGDYSLRSGEGRYIGFYMALKRTVVRATAQDFERTIRPWVIGYFTRKDKNGNDTPATKTDVSTLQSAIKALGLGSLSGVVLPDSCKVELLRAAAAMDAVKFTEFLDDQITKSFLGQTYTTSPQHHGTHGVGSTADQNTMRVIRYDASCLVDTLKRDLVYYIVKLNWPGAEKRLLPRLELQVEESPDPSQLMQLAKDATAIDIPVDVDELAARVGLDILEKDDVEGRRTRQVSAGKSGGPIEPGNDDPNDPNARIPEVGQDMGADGDQAPDVPMAPPAKKKTPPKGKPTPSKKQANSKPDDDERKADDQMAAHMRKLLLADRADPGPAVAVFDQLSEDYPAKALGWVLAAHWAGPVEVPITDIDTSTSDRWRATEELKADPDALKKYKKKLEAGDIKPIVLVKTPGNSKYVIVDGHHRTLANEQLKKNPVAYIAETHTDHGPWDDLHNLQKKGSSKTSGGAASWLPSSWLDAAKKAAEQLSTPADAGSKED